MIIKNKVLGGVLLVSGTTIGAGMLALPVVTGLAGFFPTVMLFFLYWIYMTYTAFLILEVNLWLGENINMITMAKRTLGRVGEVVSWVTYLFLLYLLTTAYLAGGAPIIVGSLHMLTGIAVPNWLGAVPLLLVFGFFVYEGTKYVDLLNRILMFGLVIAYSTMVLMMVPHIDSHLLVYADWGNIWMAISVAATSFGFHIIIPTLTTYLHHHPGKLKKVILIGSLIPLIVYLVWEMITLGVVPIEGAFGIREGYREGVNGAALLSEHLGGSAVALIAQMFSFFAIVTSFLGVTLSLTDFLADGLRIRKSHLGRCLLVCLTFVPPMFFILLSPRAFLSALEYAGAFGVVIFLGLLPPLMVWAGRYYRGFKGEFKVPGGKPALAAAIFVSLFVIATEVANKLGLIERMTNGG
jgi:tyrosine-specific transport protein